MTQGDVNEVMYNTAGAWYAGLNLIIDEVDLGDAMKYDVLRVSGRLLEKGNGDGRPTEQATPTE